METLPHDTTVTRMLTSEALTMTATFVGAMEGEQHASLATRLAEIVYAPDWQWTPEGFGSVPVKFTGRELGIIGRVLDTAWTDFVAPLETLDPGQFAVIKATFERVGAQFWEN